MCRALPKTGSQAQASVPVAIAWKTASVHGSAKYTANPRAWFGSKASGSVKLPAPVLVGAMARGDGAMGRWGDGAMGRWGDGAMGLVVSVPREGAEDQYQGAWRAVGGVVQGPCMPVRYVTTRQWQPLHIVSAVVFHCVCTTAQYYEDNVWVSLRHAMKAMQSKAEQRHRPLACERLSDYKDGCTRTCQWGILQLMPARRPAA